MRKIYACEWIIPIFTAFGAFLFWAVMLPHPFFVAAGTVSGLLLGLIMVFYVEPGDSKSGDEINLSEWGTVK